MQFVQAVLESHDAHTDRAVAQVGVTCFFDRVVIDVDHVVEHTHGCVDSALEFVVVQFVAVGTLLEVTHQID